MAEYRRPWVAGATWFFTVNLAERKTNRLVACWPYSSFHSFVKRGIYPRDWGGSDTSMVSGGE